MADARALVSTASTTRSLLEDVLAGVENEDRVGVTKARDDSRQRIGAAGVEGLRDEPDDVGRAAGVRETDVPRLRGLAFDRAGRLEGKPALADAGGRSASRGGARRRLDDLGELRLAVDERGRRAGTLPRARCVAERARSPGRARGSLRRRRSPDRAPVPLVHEDASRILKTSSASAWRPLR